MNDIELEKTLGNVATMLESVNEFHEVVYTSNHHRDILLNWHHNALKLLLPLTGILTLFNIALFFILLTKGIL